MTTENSPNQNNSYQPEQTHYCDGSITYDTTKTRVDIADTETVELTGSCDHCGRELIVTVAVDVEMIHVTDSTTGDTLHSY